MKRARQICIALSFFVAGLASAVCVGEKPQELSGTFVSDREATMSYLKSTGAYSPEQMEKIGSVVGKMKVAFAGDTVVTELDDHTISERFEVAEQGEDYIVILTNLDKEPVRNRIEFVTDGYWLISPSVEKPFREKFRRVP